ncbi:hypothetical protein [Agrobacterium rosae]|uniref:hypothetical protein n=1 Tax=Agrobacterium rosae TaxID=1972867 RepID=UPI003BA3E0FD
MAGGADIFAKNHITTVDTYAMRAIDLLKFYEGKYLFLLDKSGWIGRPWDTPLLIETVEEIRPSVIRINISGKKIEFFAKPYHNLKIFGDRGFSVFDMHEDGEVVLFSFIASDRTTPCREADPENIISCMHDISMHLIQQLKEKSS